MKKAARPIKISELRERAPNISFPEYQRESTVWDRRAQQRLIDSILRDFDIGAFYFYETATGEWECIDGRQRLTAILSFTGELNDPDNGTFPMLFDNEIAPEQRPDLHALNGKTFSDMRDAEDGELADACRRFNDFEITAVTLSASRDPLEFNLQFTRLNLGAIINSGEKLNAMDGDMHDLCFNTIGKHDFLKGINIPTRRFASEQVAAQFLCQIYSLEETGEFRRMRHYDLQRFFKQKYTMGEEDQAIAEVVQGLLTTLTEMFDADLALFRNRALTVSVVLLAWQKRSHLEGIVEFWRHFSGRLAHELDKVKALEAIDPEHRWLIDFQKDITQASVEKPALERRHACLVEEFERFRKDGKIKGDP